MQKRWPRWEGVGNSGLLRSRPRLCDDIVMGAPEFIHSLYFSLSVSHRTCTCHTPAGSARRGIQTSRQLRSLTEHPHPIHALTAGYAAGVEEETGTFCTSDRPFMKRQSRRRFTLRPPGSRGDRRHEAVDQSSGSIAPQAALDVTSTAPPRRWATPQEALIMRKGGAKTPTQLTAQPNPVNERHARRLK